MPHNAVVKELASLNLVAFVEYVEMPLAILARDGAAWLLLLKNRAFDALTNADERVASLINRCQTSETQDELARTNRTGFELTLRSVDGSVHVHQWSAHQVEEGDARILILRAVDITELRETTAIMAAMQRTIERNNSLLKIRSSKLQQILDHVPIGVFSLGQHLTIEAPVSPYTQHLLGEAVERRDFIEVFAAGISKRDAAELRANLGWAFGKDRAQWERGAARLTKTVVIGGRDFRVRFAPVFDMNEVLHQVVVVLDEAAPDVATAAPQRRAGG